MKMQRSSCFLFVLATACASATPASKIEGEAKPAPPATAPDVQPETPREIARSACETLPLFDLYEKNGAFTRSAEGGVAVHLPIDLHQVDCAAPDCFGHDMLLTLELGDESGHCVIVLAEATSTPFDGCRDPNHISKGTPWQNAFTAVGRPDLSERTLERIELRDASRGQALVLLPDTYYFYEKVTPEKKLLPRLVDAENPECCGGYTYRKTWDWTEPQERP